MKALTRLRPQAFRYQATLVAVLVALCFSLLPLLDAHASGVFWLPTKQASDASFNHVYPVLAAYHNHAYTLSVRDDGGAVTSVYFSTNESGHWTTQRISGQGPDNTFSGEFSSLAVDASTGRLYAIWAYHKNSDGYAIGVWTRDPVGQWTGPTDVMTGGFLGGQPSIVAQNGKAYATFVSGNVPGACDDSGIRAGDVEVVSYDGSTWSAPQNLTSCVSDPSLNVEDAKLAIDENSRPYLVSISNGDLWYTENAGSSWSDPMQITHGANIGEALGLNTYYGIVASNGIAYVTYAQSSNSHAADVLLMTHPLGGAWSAPVQVSPHDPDACPKWGLSIVANAGRVVRAGWYGPLSIRNGDLRERSLRLHGRPWPHGSGRVARGRHPRLLLHVPGQGGELLPLPHDLRSCGVIGQGAAVLQG